MGKPQTGRSPSSASQPEPLTVLPNNAEAKVCTAFSGQDFFCDTDYALHESCSLTALLAETWERVVCLTGGEPLIHQERDWFQAFRIQHKGETHLETSGTIVPKHYYDWLTVSPKKGWLPEVVARANAVKFLITPEVTADQIFEVWQHTGFADECGPAIMYFSPVFDPNEPVQANIDYTMELLKRYPYAQMSVQMHKFLGLR